MTRKGQMKDCEWSNTELEAPRPQGHSLWENIGRSHTGQQPQLPLSRPLPQAPLQESLCHLPLMVPWTSVKKKKEQTGWSYLSKKFTVGIFPSSPFKHPNTWLASGILHNRRLDVSGLSCLLWKLKPSEEIIPGVPERKGIKVGWDFLRWWRKVKVRECL